MASINLYFITILPSSISWNIYVAREMIQQLIRHLVIRAGSMPGRVRHRRTKTNSANAAKTPRRIANLFVAFKVPLSPARPSVFSRRSRRCSSASVGLRTGRGSSDRKRTVRRVPKQEFEVFYFTVPTRSPPRYG